MTQLATPIVHDHATIGARDYYLHECPVGHYLAGAGTRFQDRVTFLVGCRFPDGTTHGGHYRTLSEAQAHYDRSTAAWREREAEHAAFATKP